MSRGAILIFGEDYNDAKSIEYLVRAILPNGPAIKPRKTPMILSRDAGEAARRKNQNAVEAVVRAERVRGRVRAVIVHRDCDAVEPAHDDQCAKLRENYQIPGVILVPAAPAFEMEAWWFLWPAAVAEVNSKWRKLPCSRRNHGMMTNAKEKLISRLRPTTGARTNDYSEADAPRIAEKVWRMGIVNNHCGQCGSFDIFYTETRRL